MRYFSWFLGVALTVSFSILNEMWHEFHSQSDNEQVLTAHAE
jgi:cyd operon protein YbgT